MHLLFHPLCACTLDTFPAPEWMSPQPLCQQAQHLQYAGLLAQGMQVAHALPPAQAQQQELVQLPGWAHQHQTVQLQACAQLQEQLQAPVKLQPTTYQSTTSAYGGE